MFSSNRHSLLILLKPMYIIYVILRNFINIPNYKKYRIVKFTLINTEAIRRINELRNLGGISCIASSSSSSLRGKNINLRKRIWAREYRPRDLGQSSNAPCTELHSRCRVHTTRS